MADQKLNEKANLEKSIESKSLLDDANSFAYEESFGNAGISSDPLKYPRPKTSANFTLSDHRQNKAVEKDLPVDVKHNLAMQGFANKFAQAIESSVNPSKHTESMNFGTNSHHYNLARYEAMDTPFSRDYQKLGFDPFRDNEDYYNTHASAVSDTWRAMSGFSGNVTTGLTNYFQDSWLNPFESTPYAASQTAHDFAQNIGTTQSTRKGIIPFLANTYSQLGLAVGMAGGFMAETAGITLLTGGLGTELSAASGGARLLSNFGRIKKAGHFYKKIKDAQGLRKIYEVGLGLGRGIGNRITPNTLHGWKNINKVDDLASFANVGSVARGFGNFYKDVAIARMAVGESKIEGGLVYNEEANKLVNEFRKREGREPSTLEYDEIVRTAENASKTAFMWNFPLIYGTNLLVFGKMFRPMGKAIFKNIEKEVIKDGFGKVVINPKQGAKTILKSESKKTIKGGLNRAKDFIKTPRAWGQKGLNLGTGFLRYTKANFGEGVQEFFQEVIADSAIDYHADIYWSEDGDADIGEYYRLLGENTKKYMSPEGFEIFMSGFVMGGGMNMMSGAGKSIGKTAIKKGLAGKKNRVRYEEYVQRKEKYLNDITTSLNEVIKDPLKYFNPTVENFVAQKNINREKAEAEAVGDKKAFEDAVSSGDFYNITHLINTEKYDDMLDAVKDFKNLSVEEFNEATGAEVTDQNEQFELVDNMIKKAKSIETNYKRIIKAYPQKYFPEKFKKNSPEQYSEAILKLAHDRFVKNASYAGFKLDDALERRSKLYNSFTNKSIWRSKNIADQAGSDQFERLIDSKTLQIEIDLLYGEIDELTARKKEGIITTIEKADLESKVKMLELYTLYSDASKGYADLIPHNEYQIDKKNKQLGKYSEQQVADQNDAFVALHVAFINLVENMAKVNDGMVNRDEINKALSDIIDYRQLEVDAEYYNDAVNYIVSPDVYEEQVKRHSAILEDQANRKAVTILKHMEASYEQREAGAIIKEVEKAGYGFTKDGMRELFVESTVPTEFFILQNGNTITEEDKEYKVPAEIVRDFLEVVKKSGLTVEAQDKALKDERETAVEPVEETPPVKAKGFTFDNYNTWSEPLKKEAQKQFKDANKRRVNRKEKPYETIEEWIATEPETLRSKLTKANKAKPKKPVGSISEIEGTNARGTTYKGETTEKDGLKVTKYSEFGPDGKKISKGGRIMTPAAFIKEYIITDQVHLDNLEGATEIKIYEVRVGKDGKSDVSIQGTFPEGPIEMEIAGTVKKPTQQSPPSAPPLTPVKEGGYKPEVLQPEGATNEPKWKPNKKGKTFAEISDEVIQKIISNQDRVRKFKDISDDEAKKLGIDNKSHGYVILSKSGKWIKTKSVTESTGAPFDIRVNHTVIIKDSNRKGVVVESPDTNPEYFGETAEEDMYDVQLEDGEILKFVGGNLENITYVDSTDAGSLVDLMVRDFFSEGGIKAREKYFNKEDETISEEAYKNLVSSLKQLKKENPGFEFAAKGIILFDENAEDGPIAGEIDLLLYNEETGEFRIWDMKTRKIEKGPFWEVDPKVANTRQGFVSIGSPKLSENFSEEVYPNRRGINEVTSQIGYERQLSVYKNLFETQYGIRVSGTALVPYSIEFITKTDPKTEVQYLHIKNLEKESNIPLNYQPSIESIVKPVNVKHINETVGEGQIKSISPTAFESDPIDLGGRTIELPFSKEHAASLADGTKVTTLRTIKSLNNKTKFLNATLASGSIEVDGNSYTIYNSSPTNDKGNATVTRDEAGQIIAKSAKGVLEGGAKTMSEEMANKIDAVSKMDNLSKEDKNKLVMVISEGLPTEKPDNWDDNQVTVGGVTYYAKYPSTVKWLAGQGQMLLLQIKPVSRKLTPEDLTEETDAIAHYIPLIEKANSEEIKKIRTEITDPMNTMTRKLPPEDITSLVDSIEKREAELDFKTNLEIGETLTLNADHLNHMKLNTKFEEHVIVTKIEDGYIEVRNSRNSKKNNINNIYNNAFKNMILGKTADLLTEDPKEEVTFTPEEEVIIKENKEEVEVFATDAASIKEKIEKAKKMSSEDSENDFAEDLGCP